MKTSIIFESTLKNLDTTENVCKTLKKSGFDGLDYSICENWAEIPSIFNNPRQTWVDFFKEQRRIIEGEGLNVFQTHATLPSDFDYDNPHQFSKKVLDQLKREIEATAILGSKYIVIHPINSIVCPYGKPIDQDAKQRDYEINMKEFSKLKPTLLEFGVKNGVEDMFTFDKDCGCYVQTGCSTPQDMIKYVDGLNDRNAFCACLDTGHVYMHNIQPAQAVRELGDRIELLHIHDNRGGIDSHLIPGLGYTDWQDFAKALKEIDYKGALSLELSFYSALKQFGKDYLYKYLDLAGYSVKRLAEMVEKA